MPKSLWRKHPEFAERVAIVGGARGARRGAACGARRAGRRRGAAHGRAAAGQGVSVENYPGLMGSTGPAIVAQMAQQAEAAGALFEPQAVIEADLSRSPFTLRTNSTEIEAHAVILNPGASSRWLGVPGEQELRGGGVSTCATCDGFLFRDKPVVVVGGGDTAMEDALVLARTSSSVVVVHRRAAFRASKVLADRVKGTTRLRSDGTRSWTPLSAARRRRATRPSGTRPTRKRPTRKRPTTTAPRRRSRRV